MVHTSMFTHPRLRGARRSDATLRRTAVIAAVALAVLAIAGLIRSPKPIPVLSAEPVWVPCSDGWACAVGPSRGEGRTVTIRWVGKPPPPDAQEVGEDPGAAL